MSKYIFEYVWLDGNDAMPKLRSKIKVTEKYAVSDWSFDGSSTGQATTDDSDLILHPVCIIDDPHRDDDASIVLCEVLNPDGTSHATNFRQNLVGIESGLRQHQPLLGIEQEYFFTWDGRPIGVEKTNEGVIFPEQGKFYCGENIGSSVVNDHLNACIKAKLGIGGINAEVAPGQWEFQTAPLTPTACADQLWLMRFLLERLARQEGYDVDYSPKPFAPLNGSGAHHNISFDCTRGATSIDVYKQIFSNMAAAHSETMKSYGAGNQERLLGNGSFETSSYTSFNFSERGRHTSVRIPVNVVKNGYAGYFEDRRPAANIDPYCSIAALLTACNINKLV